MPVARGSRVPRSASSQPRSARPPAARLVSKGSEIWNHVDGLIEGTGDTFRGRISLVKCELIGRPWCTLPLMSLRAASWRSTVAVVGAFLLSAGSASPQLTPFGHHEAHMGPRNEFALFTGV